MYGKGIYGKALYGVYTVQDAAATVQASSGVQTDFLRLRLVSAGLTDSSVVSAAPTFIWADAANILAAGSVDVVETVENYNGATLVASSVVSALGFLTRSVNADVASTSVLILAPSLVIGAKPEPLEASSVLSAAANLTIAIAADVWAQSVVEASGRGIYVPIEDENPVWQETPDATEIWTTVPDNSPIWSETPVNG